MRRHSSPRWPRSFEQKTGLEPVEIPDTQGAYMGKTHRGYTGPIQRHRIAGSLWPESSDTQALTNLRRELHHLRDAWPGLDALVDAGSRTLAWRGEVGAVVDVMAFEAAADRGLAGDVVAYMRRRVYIRATSCPTAPETGLMRIASAFVNARETFSHV